MQWRWGWRHNQFSFVQLVPHTFGGRTLCFLEVFKADSGCYAHVPFQPLILAWRLDPTHIVYKVKYEETIGSCGPRNDCNICCVCLLEPSWCIDIVLDRVWLVPGTFLTIWAFTEAVYATWPKDKTPRKPAPWF